MEVTAVIVRDGYAQIKQHGKEAIKLLPCNPGSLFVYNKKILPQFELQDNTVNVGAEECNVTYHTEHLSWNLHYIGLIFEKKLNLITRGVISNSSSHPISIKESLILCSDTVRHTVACPLTLQPGKMIVTIDTKMVPLEKFCIVDLQQKEQSKLEWGYILNCSENNIPMEGHPMYFYARDTKEAIGVCSQVVLAGQQIFTLMGSTSKFSATNTVTSSLEDYTTRDRYGGNVSIGKREELSFSSTLTRDQTEKTPIKVLFRYPHNGRTFLSKDCKPVGTNLEWQQVLTEDSTTFEFKVNLHS
jgi:hypothetical protein